MRLLSREILELPNLLSLTRVGLAPVIGYYLWRDDPTSTVIAALLIIAAGITDGLDGYLARRMNRVTSLGVALDPIADKLFAIILVGCLIIFRDFPIWLAAVIVGRDLLIVAGGMLLNEESRISLPSNLTGKWAFAALAVLLGAYIIRFDFSIAVMTPTVVVLLAASLFGYGRVFFKIRSGQPTPPFVDRAAFKVIRYSLLAATAVAHAVMFYHEFLSQVNRFG
jgi:CDP-diacylglycerol--glycerol-3-phosphate 3-phosphatidyltransferase